ncbi:MAG: hypothetical protein K2L86_09530 [Lachnospiraceae bacterium]|nr:hypothetical protein [Lachnospiraceae bacterium]
MRGKNVFWGSFFIVMAVIVIASKIGVLPDVGVFSILASAILAWVVVDGIRHRNFYETIFAAAFLFMIYDEPLGIEALTPWTILVAALFLSIGFSFLFGAKKRGKQSIEIDWDIDSTGSKGIGSVSGQCSKSHIRCENNFGETIRYINSDNFSKARLENNFGGMKIYFDNAIIQGEMAEVKIENNFGGVILFIPKEWNVKNELEHCFGSINEHGMCLGTSSATLLLIGETNFGNIEIHYV